MAIKIFLPFLLASADLCVCILSKCLARLVQILESSRQTRNLDSVNSISAYTDWCGASIVPPFAARTSRIVTVCLLNRLSLKSVISGTTRCFALSRHSSTYESIFDVGKRLIIDSIAFLVSSNMPSASLLRSPISGRLSAPASELIFFRISSNLYSFHLPFVPPKAGT